MEEGSTGKEIQEMFCGHDLRLEHSKDWPRGKELEPYLRLDLFFLQV